MNKNRFEKQVNNRFTDLIDSIIIKAIHNCDAVSIPNPSSKNRSKTLEGFSKILIEDYILDINFEIDVKYGYSISEISCMLQEQIKKDIETNTKFKVKRINILVKNITL